MLFIITILAIAAKKKKSKGLKQAINCTVASAEDSAATRQLRNQIFPTLYAIFQQSRGSAESYKIKNRSLRSLLRSCLYHKTEDQLRRTLEDANSLLQKYCQRLEGDI